MSRGKQGKPRRIIFAKRHRFDDDTHPLRLYLDGFDEASRRTMASALDSVADILTDGKVVASDLAWLKHRGRDAGPLFNRVTQGGDVRPEGITAQLIYHVARQCQLGVGIKAFTPHDVLCRARHKRRSFISDLLDEGVDIATVARQVGHSNVQTTARYDRRDDTAQQRGVSRLDVPFG